MNPETRKQQRITITAVAAILILLATSTALMMWTADEAYADAPPTHIVLDESIAGTTITVHQDELLSIPPVYNEWYGGWFNTKYSEEYFLRFPGMSPDEEALFRFDIFRGITAGIKTVHFAKVYTDHGLAIPTKTQTNYTFYLNVLENTKVTYKSNTSDFQFDWVDKTRAGSQLTVRDTTSTVDNHDFVGWNTNASGTGTWYQPGAKISSSTTLYAQWSPELVVTSESSVILDKGNNIDYTVITNQPGVNVKLIDKTQVPSLNLSNGRITGIVDNEPGKYSVKIQLEKGVQKADFWLTIYVRIYEIEPIDEFAYTGESWARNIELMPTNVTYKLTYGSITHTHNGQAETVSPAYAGLSNLSGTTVAGTFVHPGTYLINITVTAPNNPELKSTNVQLKVLVEEPEPTVFPPSYDRIIVTASDIPDTFDFYVKDPQNYLQISWNFGDGKSSTGQFAVHHYDYPGNYEWSVTLKAFDGFDDVIQSGYVLSTGPAEPPIDSWIDVKYAVMVEAPVTSTLSGPDFLSGDIITDSVTGKTYMLISGTPDAENWSDKTGITYDVKIYDGDEVIKSWQINLHGGSSEIPVSSFLIEVSDYTVTATYLGSKNSVIYIAWDGQNYVRLSGISGTHEFSEPGTYVCPIIITLAGTQISDTIAFEIRSPDSVHVSIGVIQDITVNLGDSLNVPVTLHPHGATVVLSGAEWIEYKNGRIIGTPEEIGTYTITVYAEYGQYTTETQTFVITVSEAEEPLPDSSDSNVQKGIKIAHIILIVIGVLAVVTFITRAIRYGLATAIMSIIFLGVL